MEIIQCLLTGDRRAIARLITIIENDGAEAQEALAALYPHTGRAHVVGVTGAPGTGKSTLVNELAKVYRQRERTVGIIAVDPTSPFSGGALLGDRIRMRDLSGDPGIFIRSMATRGSLGGLARATADAIKVLDAAGYQTIFVETVGAGQAEVDIAKAAHTTIVVEAPGLGDDIQAIKAGITEIADIFVVNKADREGADSTALALQMILDLNHSSHISSPDPRWRPPICKTVALHGEGVGAVVEAIGEHAAYLRESGNLQRRERERVEGELRSIITHKMARSFFERVAEAQFDSLVDSIIRRELDPYSAAARLLEGWR
ncbi:MAG: methylmalonyl Co-A mutase-associated GTPase MeaB [Chloroflexi bacterium]|nr:methylmalonyl Co-A mutase-associated GTPase MeaB [Chloroflexota bacterium]